MIGLTTFLPRIRKALLSLTLISATLCFFFAIALLIYQKTKTRGYQKPVPAIIAASFLAAAFSSHWLFSKPFADINRITLFLRSIFFEVVTLAGSAAWLFVVVTDLGVDTPGLLHCGKYVMCRLLLAVLSLTWITFLFTALSSTLLLLSTLYLSIRRRHAIEFFSTPFEDAPWGVYKGRPLNRALSGRSEKLRERREARQAKEETVVDVMGKKDEGELTEDEKRIVGFRGEVDFTPRHSMAASEFSNNSGFEPLKIDH